MSYIKCTGIFLLLVVLCPKRSFAQYILNGSATQESCNCYVLTTEQISQAGSVWQATKIDLDQPFDFTFNVFLGCRDVDGADGIVFILQPNSTSIGAVGEGLGFQGIIPSVGIPLDTWQNAGDPAYDNISIKINGDISNNNNLAGPVPASNSDNNIEDCKWHDLRIVWDPSKDSLSTYFDDVFRLGAKVDLVKEVFNNDPMVYWGFTGATGGSFNIQKFCNQMKPSFETELPGNALCLGESVQFKNSSVHYLDIKSHSWNFGDGKTSTEADATHLYTAPGKYTVTYQFTAIDGCESTVFTQDIHVGSRPKIDLKINDTCQSFQPKSDPGVSNAYGGIKSHEWRLDNQLFSTQENPDFTALPPGDFTLSLQVVSEYGCLSNLSETAFTIKPKPDISFTAKDGCENEPVSFDARQADALPVASWTWRFANDRDIDGKNVVHTFSGKGNYEVTLRAVATNGCNSEFTRTVFINSPDVSITNDTIVSPGAPFQLIAGGGVSYAWTPVAGLSNPAIANPTAVIADDIRYVVTVSTAEGCTDTASVNIIAFKEAAIYVPNAFTPNGDGVNDFLRPYLVGIRSLAYFTIFDRWGNKIFSTDTVGHGWDGTYKGLKSSSGYYAWILGAKDVVGKEYVLKGSFLLID